MGEHSFRNFKCCHAVWIDVYDHAGGHKFTFEDKDCLQCGPNCICTTFVINVFDGKDTDGAPCATLKNVFPGCNFKGLCSKADNLELSFNRDMTVDEKALLFSTAFLVDFLLFEKQDEGDGGMGG